MPNEYDHYDEWKGWGEDQFMVLSDQDRAYFAAEFAGLKVRGEKVLEIGFGSGTLLAWLGEQGAERYGTELSPQGQTLARQRGVRVLDTELSDAAALKGQFGIVAAFDVLEHLTHQQIRDVLAKAALLLRPGGHFVARFPNGASPFGGLIQHSDVTHVTTLTTTKLGQLMLGTPFVIQRAGDTAIPRNGSVPVRLAKQGRALLRRMLERSISALYGLGDMAFYHNLTVVLRRVEDTPSTPSQVAE